MTSQTINASLYESLQNECNVHYEKFPDFAHNMCIVMEDYLFKTILNNDVNGLTEIFNSIQDCDPIEKIGLLSYIASIEYNNRFTTIEHSKIMKLIYDMFPDFYPIMIKCTYNKIVSSRKKIKQIRIAIKKHYALKTHRPSFEKMMNIVKTMDCDSKNKDTRFPSCEFYFVKKSDFKHFFKQNVDCNIPSFAGHNGSKEIELFLDNRQYDLFKFIDPIYAYMLSGKSNPELWIGKWFLSWVEDEFNKKHYNICL